MGWPARLIVRSVDDGVTGKIGIDDADTPADGAQPEHRHQHMLPTQPAGYPDHGVGDAPTMDLDEPAFEVTDLCLSLASIP
jgi:hypothetical protein